MVRSVLIALGLLLLAAAAGCGGGAEEGSGTVAGGEEATPPVAKAGGPAAAGAARPAAIAWEDPEPPDAQARAEAMVGAAWNRDKTTRLAAPASFRLAMSISRLVDTRTGITGFRSAVAAREASLDDRLARLGAEVGATEVTIRLPGSVLFDFDSAAIRPDAERALSDVAAVIAGYPGRPVRIEGHTDSIASDAYNQKLSEERAASVRAWLIAHGVDGKRLATTGFGESKPVADNATAAGRQHNRRVEVVIAKG